MMFVFLVKKLSNQPYPCELLSKKEIISRYLRPDMEHYLTTLLDAAANLPLLKLG
jgi:hypothetical protein